MNQKKFVTNIPSRFTRLAAAVSVATIMSIVPIQSALAQSSPTLTDFAVIGGPAVTLTGATVNGNLATLGAFTNTGGVVNGAIVQGADAQPAYNEFLGEYAALEQEQCFIDLTGQSLNGMTLTPGTYCFDAAVTETGSTLILDAQGDDDALFLFKVGILGTGALTGTSFNVEFKDGVGDECNVFWWVSQAATMTDSNFIGTVLAGAAITVSYSNFEGNTLAKEAVTLTGATVGCTPWTVPVSPRVLPQAGEIKVTGGGQIAVSGGKANFGFNAKPGKYGDAKGNLNYVNHVSGLHVNGSVDTVVVSDFNADDSPRTVLFSGTYAGGTFSATVQDNGEPGVDDQFGIWVSATDGALTEAETMRISSRGNIQFHK